MAVGNLLERREGEGVQIMKMRGAFCGADLLPWSELVLKTILQYNRATKLLIVCLFLNRLHGNFCPLPISCQHPTSPQVTTKK